MSTKTAQIKTLLVLAQMLTAICVMDQKDRSYELADAIAVLSKQTVSLV